MINFRAKLGQRATKAGNWLGGASAAIGPPGGRVSSCLPFPQSSFDQKMHEWGGWEGNLL